MHDGEPSERAVWVDGVPHPVGPADFADDLTSVAAGENRVSFAAEAARSRRERLVRMSSDYEQPFGTFAGEVPGGGALREGWGVMERHAVAW